MLDYKPTLVAALDEALDIPVYYELFVDSTTATPCVTYIEQNDYAEQEGNTIRYSRKRFRIKIWGDDLATLSVYLGTVDDTMFSLGFKRVNYNELWYNEQLCMIVDYLGLAKED